MSRVWKDREGERKKSSDSKGGKARILFWLEEEQGFGGGWETEEGLAKREVSGISEKASNGLRKRAAQEEKRSESSTFAAIADL